MTKLLLALWASGPILVYLSATDSLASMNGTPLYTFIGIYLIWIAPYVFFGTTLVLLGKFGLMPIINYLFKESK